MAHTSGPELGWSIYSSVNYIVWKGHRLTQVTGVGSCYSGIRPTFSRNQAEITLYFSSKQCLTVKRPSLK